MPNRRDLLIGTLAMGASTMNLAGAASARPLAGARTRPVRRAIRRDETIVRLGGLGDGYYMSWDTEGRQFVVVNDGPGWLEPPTAFYNTRLWEVTGSPQATAFREVGGYPSLDSSTR